jgi:hypothetical protein
MYSNTATFSTNHATSAFGTCQKFHNVFVIFLASKRTRFAGFFLLVRHRASKQIKVRGKTHPETFVMAPTIRIAYCRCMWRSLFRVPESARPPLHTHWLNLPPHPPFLWRRQSRPGSCYLTFQIPMAFFGCRKIACWSEVPVRSGLYSKSSDSSGGGEIRATFAFGASG